MINKLFAKSIVAVEVEFANVIIRKSALDAKYPGGLDAFAVTELPNYIEDDNLVRVGFMSTGEAFDLADGLTHHGLSFDDTTQSDIAVVQHNSCPDWLTTGSLEDSVGCWLAGNDSGPLVRCTNGFLLRCPRALFNRLETALESIAIVVTRSEPPPEDQKDFIEVVHFARDTAFIAANVVGDKSGDSPVGLWASRDLSRRQHCADDTKFALELEAALLEHGAEGT